MRKEERPKHVKRVNTVGEAAISDHKPKKMVVELKRRKWRKVSQKRVPRVNWEALRSEEVTRLFHRRMGEEMAVPGEEEEPGSSDAVGEAGGEGGGGGKRGVWSEAEVSGESVDGGEGG